MHSFRLLRFQGLLAICGASSACSMVVDAERVQCTTDADCTRRKGDFVGSVCVDSVCKTNPTWQCLDEPPSGESLTGEIHLSTRVVSMGAKQPLTGITVALCAKLDVTCLDPQSTFTSGSMGELDIVMRAGFDGYLKAEGQGLSPTLFFFPLLYESRDLGSLPMTNPAFSAALFQQLGTAFTGDRGVITFSVLNCARQPAAGVVLTSSTADLDTIPFYLVNGLPSRDVKMTDTVGVGGFVNVPIGTMLLTATLAAEKRKLDLVSVVTRPGYLSMVLIDPTSR